MNEKRVFSSVGQILRILVILIIVLAFMLGWNMIMSTGTGQTWHGITVGKTTMEEALTEFGIPSRREHLGDTTFLFYHSGPLDFAAHKVTVQEAKIVMIEEDMAVYFPRRVYLSEFVTQYGVPDYVRWSKDYPSRRAVVFERNGIVAIATVGRFNDSQIVRAFFFQPCSTICTQLRFVELYTPIDPFPDSDVIGQENPWSLDFQNLP